MDIKNVIIVVLIIGAGLFVSDFMLQRTAKTFATTFAETVNVQMKCK